MIPHITELNFPEYATLSTATVNLEDMGEQTISATVKIPDSVTPDFSYDWEIMFRGSRFVMPLRNPQAKIQNTSLNDEISLTFHHWAIYQLKRYFFCTVQSIAVSTIAPDQYMASVKLSLREFCDLFGKVLQHYYGDDIAIDLCADWNGSNETLVVEINYSTIWDVLLKFYELWKVRWAIHPTDNGSKYVIKVGYPQCESKHIFKYGFEGGLLSIEHQVQSDDIKNILLGRGCETNLPAYYFKKAPEGSSFKSDPDAIPELELVHFAELRSATFRSYIQGWKKKHYNGTASEGDAYSQWAYQRGFNDEKFNPCDYSKDDESIATYGEKWGGLSNNTEIFPTIQGITREDIGRVDEAVFIEHITDDSTAAEDAQTTEITLPMCSQDSKYIGAGGTVTFSKFVKRISVPIDKVCNINVGLVTNSTYELTSNKTVVDGSVITLSSTAIAVNSVSGEEIGGSGIGAGSWDIYYKVTLENPLSRAVWANTFFGEGSATIGNAPDVVANGFDVWVKNIWNTAKAAGESDSEYAERAWRPILGDRLGNEASICFASGNLSASEDYVFKIAGIPAYDTSKTLNGIPSHWRITLAKSSADYDALGVMVPNTRRNGNAGDLFVFTGIDMPFMYVADAEKRLDAWRKESLRDVCDIKPSRVVTTDRVRLCNSGNSGALIDEINVGTAVVIFDNRYIKDSHQEKLTIQSVTLTYREASSSDAALNPDVSFVLVDKPQQTASTISQLEGSVNALARQIGSISNVESVVRTLGDKLYLRKYGTADKSISPTEFLEGVSFAKGFTAGAQSNARLSIDTTSGASTLEVDNLFVRMRAQFEELVVSKASVISGKQYITPAGSVNIASVEDLADRYRCYFLLEHDGERVECMLTANDMVVSKQFGGQSQRYYWRTVMAVSQPMGAKYGYVDLSKADCLSESDVPMAEDVICHFGHRDNAHPERQNAIVISSVDSVSPSLVMYSNICDYSDVESKAVFAMGYDHTLGESVLRVGNEDSAKGWLKYTQSAGLTIAGDIKSIKPRVLKMGLSADGDSWLAVGESVTIFCNIYAGLDDVTSEMSAWSVTRYTGDDAQDNFWNRSTKALAFNSTSNANIASLTLSLDDIKPYSRATFTFTAMRSDGVQAVAVLDF